MNLGGSGSGGGGDGGSRSGHPAAAAAAPAAVAASRAAAPSRAAAASRAAAVAASSAAALGPPPAAQGLSTHKLGPTRSWAAVVLNGEARPGSRAASAGSSAASSASTSAASSAGPSPSSSRSSTPAPGGKKPVRLLDVQHLAVPAERTLPVPAPAPLPAATRPVALPPAPMHPYLHGSLAQRDPEGWEKLKNKGKGGRPGGKSASPPNPGNVEGATPPPSLVSRGRARPFAAGARGPGYVKRAAVEAFAAAAAAAAAAGVAAAPLAAVPPPCGNISKSQWEAARSGDVTRRALEAAARAVAWRSEAARLAHLDAVRALEGKAIGVGDVLVAAAAAASVVRVGLIFAEKALEGVKRKRGRLGGGAGVAAAGGVAGSGGGGGGAGAGAPPPPPPQGPPRPPPQRLVHRLLKLSNAHRRRKLGLAKQYRLSVALAFTTSPDLLILPPVDARSWGRISSGVSGNGVLLLTFPPPHYSTPTHTVCTPPANCAFNPPYPPPSNTQQYSRLIELGRLPIAVAAAAARRGVTVVASSEAYTSMLCSCCRKLHRNLGASITFECPTCRFITQCVSCAPLALFYVFPF